MIEHQKTEFTLLCDIASDLKHARGLVRQFLSEGAFTDDVLSIEQADRLRSLYVGLESATKGVRNLVVHLTERQGGDAVEEPLDLQGKTASRHNGEAK